MELEQLLMLPQNASLLMDGGSGERISSASRRGYIGSRASDGQLHASAHYGALSSPQVHRISQTAAALVVTGDELTLIAGYNWAPTSAPALVLRATAFVKS